MLVNNKRRRQVGDIGRQAVQTAEKRGKVRGLVQVETAQFIGPDRMQTALVQP